jgi:hypothetical protein
MVEPKGERLHGAIAFNADLLFELAQFAYWQTTGAASDVQPDQRQALVALVFSAATLEAFINEAIAFASSLALSWTLLPNDSSGVAYQDPLIVKFLGLLSDAEEDRVSVQLKYNLAAIAFTGQPFRKGEQPYQDLDLLIMLRNWIVHLKPRDQFYVSGPAAGEYAVEPPRQVREALRSRGLIDQTATTKLSWTRQIATRATARWACNTASAMINRTIDLIPVPQPFQVGLQISYLSGFPLIEKPK